MRDKVLDEIKKGRAVVIVWRERRKPRLARELIENGIVPKIVERISYRGTDLKIREGEIEIKYNGIRIVFVVPKGAYDRVDGLIYRIYRYARAYRTMMMLSEPLVAINDRKEIIWVNEKFSELAAKAASDIIISWRNIWIAKMVWIGNIDGIWVGTYMDSMVNEGENIAYRYKVIIPVGGCIPADEYVRAIANIAGFNVKNAGAVSGKSICLDDIKNWRIVRAVDIDVDDKIKENMLSAWLSSLIARGYIKISGVEFTGLARW